MDVPDPRVTADDLSQHEWPIIAVLNIGKMDHRMNKIAFGIGDDVPLAALDLFARVIAPWPANLGSFVALDVAHPVGSYGRSMPARTWLCQVI